MTQNCDPGPAKESTKKIQALQSVKTSDSLPYGDGLELGAFFLNLFSFHDIGMARSGPFRWYGSCSFLSEKPAVGAILAPLRNLSQK